MEFAEHQFSNINSLPNNSILLAQTPQVWGSVSQHCPQCGCQSQALGALLYVSANIYKSGNPITPPQVQNFERITHSPQQNILLMFMSLSERLQLRNSQVKEMYEAKQSHRERWAGR